MSQHYPEGPATGPLQAPPPPPQYPGQSYDERQPYGEPGQPYGYAGYDNQRPRTNVMAILGLIFAFVFSPLGFVFSVIGLRQIKRRREGGKGLAISGLVLSIVFLLIGLLIALVALPAVVSAAKTAQDQASAKADTHGVKAACTVIVPALTQMNTDVAQATTPDEYSQVLTQLRTTIEKAAHTSTDPVFIQDVQSLSFDFQKAIDLTNAGVNPASLKGVLTTDGSSVGNDCTAAGYAG